ncbi:MAG: hypothetical protein IPJ65_28890 [Archangiaceae bacterium]|nr:hypothetical protein [Archangiaceae bacterium]
MVDVRWVAAVLVAVGCKSPAPAVTSAPAQVEAPATAAKCVPKILVAREGTPKLDGELDEPVWHAAAATEAFVNDGSKRVVPHTEARAAYDAEKLYLALYSADAKLQSSDEVEVRFGEHGAVAMGPDGSARCQFGAAADCAAAGVVTKLERDGDVDADKEEDEEWIVEVAVPWKVLGADRHPAELPVAFSRSETLDGQPLKEVWSRRCGALRFE